MAELILALDLPTTEAAEKLCDRVPMVQWVKIGSLFTRAGPYLVRVLLRRGLHVFLDCKWHDIPRTVAAHVQAARDLGVHMATVHASGGRAMLEAAAAVAGPLELVGVTVLTSQPAAPGAVTGLALASVAAGLRGVVCGAHEADAVRLALGPGPYIVVPGIRRVSDPPNDQVRVGLPPAAATHLVVGRPILEAADPAAAAQEFLALAPA